MLYLGKKVKEELNSWGIATVDLEIEQPDPSVDPWQYFDEFELDPEVGAVVQGNDPVVTRHCLAIMGLYLQ